MARGKFTVTNAWVQVAVGAVAITVTKEGRGAPLLFNETATDVNANQILPGKGTQAVQNETKTTFVRSDGTGWEILVDGVLI